MKLAITIAIAFVVLIPLLILPAFAESQTLPTDKATLDIKISHEPIEPNIQTEISIDFINPFTQEVQVHIDYTVAVSKDGETVFGPTQLIHTNEGSVKIPIDFNLGEGVYSMDVRVKGILFQPIPTETVSFDIIVGDAYAQPVTSPKNEESLISVQTDDDHYYKGGTVVVSGFVDIIIGDTPVTIQLFSSGRSLIAIEQATVSFDGSYTQTFLPDFLWEQGDIIVEVIYGEGNIAETEFSYTPEVELLENGCPVGYPYIWEDELCYTTIERVYK